METFMCLDDIEESIIPAQLGLITNILISQQQQIQEQPQPSLNEEIQQNQTEQNPSTSSTIPSTSSMISPNQTEQHLSTSSTIPPNQTKQHLSTSNTIPQIQTQENPSTSQQEQFFTGPGELSVDRRYMGEFYSATDESIEVFRILQSMLSEYLNASDTDKIVYNNGPRSFSNDARSAYTHRIGVLIESHMRKQTNFTSTFQLFF